jgi:hypothetical protein
VVRLRAAAVVLEEQVLRHRDLLVSRAASVAALHPVSGAGRGVSTSNHRTAPAADPPAARIARRWVNIPAMPRPLPALALLALPALLAAGACSGSGDPPAAEARTTAPAEPAPPPVRRAACPPDAANCAAVTGRVLYVEAVDPDGDGDAHYVLLGGGVTAPGITVVDVSARLRPARLPRRGEQVSAAGPVYRGSFGQRQIEAVQVFHER